MTKEEALKKLADIIFNAAKSGYMPYDTNDELCAMNIAKKHIDVFYTSLPSNLEQAAEKYAHSLGYDEEKERVEIAAAKDDFIAGAEWQRKQDQQLIELAEDHAMLAGMNKMKEQMMEKAVGGRYMKAYSRVYVESWPLDIDPDSVKAGDEVRLIVIPE